MGRFSLPYCVLLALPLSGCLGTEWMTLRLARETLTGNAWQSAREVTSCNAVQDGDQVRVMVVTALEDGKAWAYGACGRDAGHMVGTRGDQEVRLVADHVSGCALEDVQPLRGEPIPCLAVPAQQSIQDFAAQQGDQGRHAVLAQLRELMVLEVWLPPEQGRLGDPVRVVQESGPESRPVYLTNAPTSPALWRSALYWSLLPCLACVSLCASPFILLVLAVAWAR